MMSGIATICFLLIVKGRCRATSAPCLVRRRCGRDLRPRGRRLADVTGAILVAGVVLAAVGVLIHYVGSGPVNRSCRPWSRVPW